MTAPKRHNNVPASAEWFPEWKQWGAGARVGGKRNGPWKFWRADGSLQEESIAVDDVLHGISLRYHPDGKLAAKERHDHGVLRGLEHFVSDRPSDEKGPDLVPAIRGFRVELDVTGKWQSMIEFFDAKGRRLTLAGKKAPPVPAGLPELACLNDEATEYRVGLYRDGKFTGVHRAWSLKGEPLRVQYLGGDQNVVLAHATNRRASSNGNPLIAAALANDDAAVEELLALGLAGEPGAALHAAFEGKTALARRIATLVAKKKPKPFAAHAAQKRPAALPAGATFVPALGQWVQGTVSANAASPAITAWEVDDETGEIDEVTFLVFDGDVLRSRKTHRGADETGRLKEQTWFDERGNRVRRRKFDYDGTFEETEWLPSVGHGRGAGRIERRGEERTLGEKHYDEKNDLVRVVGFDDAGQTRMDLDVTGRTGRALDATGKLVGSGPVDDEGTPSGTWKIAGGGTVSVEGVGLGSSARSSELLPLLARLDKARVPALLAPAMELAWGRFEAFFDIDGKTIPRLLRMVALDEPVSVSFALDSLSDEIYHQQTITDLTGPVLRFVIALAGVSKNEEALESILDLVANIVYRGFDLDAAHTIKKAYAKRKGTTPKELAQVMSKAHVERAYGEIVHALQAQAKNLARWTGSTNADVAKNATKLLALVEGADAARHLGTLVERASGLKKANAKAEAALTVGIFAALGLSLFPRAQAPLATLQGALDSKEEELRTEAALTLIRIGAEGARAIEVAIAALKDGEADAGIVLTLLPDASRYLADFVALIGDATTVEIYGIARAALALALASGPRDDESDDDESDDDGEILPALRQVLEALVDAEAFWRMSVNAHEVLGDFDLPRSRNVIRALLAGKEPEEDDGDGIMTAASGMEGTSVASWRDVPRPASPTAAKKTSTPASAEKKAKKARR